jgi:hypothetical protein
MCRVVYPRFAEIGPMSSDYIQVAAVADNVAEMLFEQGL